MCPVTLLDSYMTKKKLKMSLQRVIHREREGGARKIKINRYTGCSTSGIT